MKQFLIPGFFIVLFILAISLFGCITNPQENGKGILQGHISIGPICPVERNPPDPNCQPTEETYAAYTLTVYGIGAGDPGVPIEVTKFQGDKNGNYRIELPEGTYEIIFPPLGGSGISSFHATVEIKSGETTNLDIDIDTGIR